MQRYFSRPSTAKLDSFFRHIPNTSWLFFPLLAGIVALFVILIKGYPPITHLAWIAVFLFASVPSVMVLMARSEERWAGRSPGQRFVRIAAAFGGLAVALGITISVTSSWSVVEVIGWSGLVGLAGLPPAVRATIASMERDKLQP
jgi:hypothetical protein